MAGLRLDVLLDLGLDLAGLLLDVLDDGLDALGGGGVVGCDSGDLDEADDAEEEVDGGEEVVLGLDDQAPSGPDEAGAGQGKVLSERELLDGARKVGDAGDDESPLHDRSPEMHSLEANLALPHSVEPALLLRLGAGAGALPAAALALVEARLGTERLAEGALAEERARGAEERGCRGHLE